MKTFDIILIVFFLGSALLSGFLSLESQGLVNSAFDPAAFIFLFILACPILALSVVRQHLRSRRKPAIVPDFEANQSNNFSNTLFTQIQEIMSRFSVGLFLLGVVTMIVIIFNFNYGLKSFLKELFFECVPPILSVSLVITFICMLRDGSVIPRPRLSWDKAFLVIATFVASLLVVLPVFLFGL